MKQSSTLFFRPSPSCETTSSRPSLSQGMYLSALCTLGGRLVWIRGPTQLVQPPNLFGRKSVQVPLERTRETRV